MLNVTSEFAPLKDVAVCVGEFIPEYEGYQNDDPEFTKYHHEFWDKELLIRQQYNFFETLDQRGITLHHPKRSPKLEQQMFTRDVGFVVGDTFYYSPKRKRKDRNGEIEKMLPVVQAFYGSKIKALQNGFIEGGDVLIDEDIVFVGLGSRTSPEIIDELSQFFNVHACKLGPRVMHLDTRFSILPKKLALVYRENFTTDDVSLFESRYRCLSLTREEAESLGCNVFWLNTETVIMAKQHQRVQDILRNEKFEVISIDYSEPIRQGGSFHCTTMPLRRL